MPLTLVVLEKEGEYYVVADEYATREDAENDGELAVNGETVHAFIEFKDDAAHDAISALCALTSLKEPNPINVMMTKVLLLGLEIGRKGSDVPTG